VKITNKFSLPTPLVKAITSDSHPRSGFSVTDLIQPPRITQLTRRHWDEIEIDASDRIWVLLGSAIHYVLDKSDIPETEREQVVSVNIDGFELVGRVDLSHNLTTFDYKVTSVWSFVFEPDGRSDWHSQLNIYRWMRLKNNLPTDRIRVCAILRDWQQSKTLNADYPPVPVAIINIPIGPTRRLNPTSRNGYGCTLRPRNCPTTNCPYALTRTCGRSPRPTQL
jgi:hypothetical protein